MRTILTALTLGLAAGTAAYAAIPAQPLPGRSAGILTCRTLPSVSLVFGKTRVAACSFEADRSSFSQGYGALLPPGDTDGLGDITVEAGEAIPETIVWRVVTPDGTVRPGLLDGRFTRAGTDAVLYGTAARLESIVGGAGTATVTLGASDGAVEMGALR